MGIVDLNSGEIHNLTRGKVYQARPFPEFRQRLMAAGGLINYVRERVAADGLAQQEEGVAE